MATELGRLQAELHRKVASLLDRRQAERFVRVEVDEEAIRGEQEWLRAAVGTLVAWAKGHSYNG